MRIRQHRGSLSDSMDTVETIDPTREAISAWAQRVYDIKCPQSDLEVKPYCYDQRIHWDTYLVSLKGYGVLGMSDGPVQ